MIQLYTNAADVLPPELLAQVQKYWRGRLWIPGKAGKQRDEVLALIRSGMKAQEIADALAISPRRVYQVADSLGDNNPFRRKPHVPLAHNSRLAPV